MDALLKILQTPIGTILALAGIAIVFLAFFEVSKGTVKMRKTPKDGFVPAAIGAALILGGLFISRTQTATPVEPTSIPMAFTEISPVVPSATVATTDTSAPTEITSPSETSVVPTETASPVPVKTIAEGCIADQTWQPAPSEAASTTSKEDNCWNLSSLGLAAANGALSIQARDLSTSTVSAGIYTAIGDQSTIEFKVSVTDLYTVYPNSAPAYIIFSIAPQGVPMAQAGSSSSGSARFKLQVDDSKKDTRILYLLADTSDLKGSAWKEKHPSRKNTYTIRLVLEKVDMKVFIDDLDTKITLHIPSGPKVFYVGYSIPVQGFVDAKISNITIDKVSK